MRKAALKAPGEEELLLWRWPKSPSTISCFDKYVDLHYQLHLAEAVWIVKVQGRRDTLRFSPEPTGHLQRSLLILTQSGNSPSAIAKFGRNVVRYWHVCVRVLAAGPDELAEGWAHDEIEGIEGARAVKTLLKLSCKASVGPWTPAHLDQVKALDSFAGKAALRQKNSVKKREKILAADVQAGLARVLDSSSPDDATQNELEGLAALALMLQHGFRPVQLLAMRPEHVTPLKDGPGCTVSIHRAKKKGGEVVEMVREVQPEWASFVIRLREACLARAQRRLFSCSNADGMWACVKAACRRQKMSVEFTAYWLRHTAGQRLADAGQSRGSIKAFLGHEQEHSAAAYHRGSKKQAEFINTALGASKLYTRVAGWAAGDFVTPQEMEAAPEEQQIGGFVGGRLIAGIGLCRSGQQSCKYDPVISCYGCDRHLPSLDRTSHEEAIEAMRFDVLVHAKDNRDGSKGNAPLQLVRALSEAQAVLVNVDAILGRGGIL